MFSVITHCVFKSHGFEFRTWRQNNSLVACFHLRNNSWFSRDVTKILKSKPGGLQKFYLHLRKDYLKIYSCTIPLLDIVHSFENRRVSISEFSSCVTSEDGCGRAVPHLQNDSHGDFQHSKQCKYKEKYLSKFSNVHKRKQTSLLAKVNSRCFFLFPAAMLVPMYMGTNMASPY